MKKFRAFCPFNGTMWYCDETDGDTSFNFYFEKDVLKAQIWIDKNEDDIGIFHDGWFSPEQYDCIVMQQVPFEQWENKPIFEDDIVKFHYFYGGGGLNGFKEEEHSLIGIVKQGMFGWGLEAIKGEHWCGYTGYNNGEGDSSFMDLCAMNESGIHEESFEVIGNIHENPELIKL